MRGGVTIYILIDALLVNVFLLKLACAYLQGEWDSTPSIYIHRECERASERARGDEQNEENIKK